MVECKQCQTEFEFEQTKPEVDEDGFYFPCPLCQHRNVLVNIGRPGEQLLLTQLDS